jgi:hypothetical protein
MTRSLALMAGLAGAAGAAGLTTLVRPALARSALRLPDAEATTYALRIAGMMLFAWACSSAALRSSRRWRGRHDSRRAHRSGTLPIEGNDPVGKHRFGLLIVAYFVLYALAIWTLSAWFGIRDVSAAIWLGFSVFMIASSFRLV